MDVQHKLSSWQVLVGVAILFAVGIAWAGENPPAAGQQGAITLVGRGGDVTVTEKNGESHSVNTKGLVLKNRAAIEVQEGPSPEELEQWAERKKAQDEKKAIAEVQRKAGTQEKKAAPAMCPAKQQAIEKLRQYQKWGTLYFYTKDNKPVSNDELTNRLDSGNIEDLKIVDGQQRECSVVPPVSEEPEDDTGPPPPGPRQRK